MSRPKRPHSTSSLRRARPLLGTIVEIAAVGPADALSSAIDAAFASIGEIQRLMSFHDAGSDVSRINSAIEGEEVPVDPHTWRVLARALELSRLSDGAFDVTTAAVLARHGFLPHRQAQCPPSPGVVYRDLELGAAYRVKWHRKGWIDLGGIAKGYAVDCAIAALQAADIAGGVVNAGGDLRCFGERQPIHVRHPAAPTELISLGWLADGAIATSSGYFAGVTAEGAQIDPLADPQRGVCVAWNASVSVLAADCMTADALTKIVRLAHADAPELLAALDAQAIVIDDESRMSVCGPEKWQWREMQ